MSSNPDETPAAIAARKAAHERWREKHEGRRLAPPVKPRATEWREVTAEDLERARAVVESARKGE